VPLATLNRIESSRRVPAVSGRRSRLINGSRNTDETGLSGDDDLHISLLKKMETSLRGPLWFMAP
jgi:hypothetical protein